MADFKSRYVTNVVVYEEKGTDVEEEGIGYEVVRSLCTNFKRCWHIIVCDNLFNSLRLFHTLMVDGFEAIGTLRFGRLDILKVIVQ